MMKARTRCPIQSEILIVGIDVAKGKHLAVACAGDGREMPPLSFGNDAEGFSELVRYCEASASETGAKDFVVALEPSGHYAESLVAWLSARRVEVYRVQPLHTNRLKSIYDGTWRKTDRKDAAVIAELCRQGWAKPYRILQGPFAELRVLVRRRQGLIKRRSQAINRLHRHLDVMFPELMGHFRKLESASCRWVLRHAPTPAQVLDLGLDELSDGLRTASRGQLGRGKAREILASAEASVGVTEGIAAHRLCLHQQLEALSEVARQLERVEAAMCEQLRGVPYVGRLLSVPRIGVITVATLLGELGDLRDYRVARQLIAMVGLDLVESTSGQRRGARTISRRGRAYGRYILYLAALRLGNTVLAEPRRRMVEERNKHATQAAMANMARLLRIFHALVRDDVDFDPERLAPSV